VDEAAHTTPLERINREIGRRTGVVLVFDPAPSGALA
jgi:hypothetical protein